MGPSPLASPRDLTIPDAGSKTAYGVLSRAIGRLLGEVRPMLRARAGGRAFDDVGALASTLRRPNAGVLVRAMRGVGGKERDVLATELVALVGFELASSGALTSPVRVERLPARIVSIANRCVVDVPEEATAATFGPDGCVFHRRDGSDVGAALDAALLSSTRARTPYHDVDGAIVLALEDNNPLAMIDAHPDKEGNRIDLGGHDATEWTRVLRSSLGVIAAHMPDLRREMDLFVSQIIPVGFDREKHLSASYREAIGTIYLTLHPSEMTMTEALVHEFSHNKINALFEVDDVLENAFFPLYKSPVRPDPRPLHGVLLAVHAFLPVARLYERMIEARHPLAEQASFRARYEDVIRINREGAAVVLEHAKPTRVGRAVLDEIARWDAHFSRAVSTR